eukprot:gene32139-47915_t
MGPHKFVAGTVSVVSGRRLSPPPPWWDFRKHDKK